jgi:hypothetical protein
VRAAGLTIAVLVLLNTFGHVTPVAAAPRTGKACPEGAKPAIIDAYSKVFSRAFTLGADERAARLVHGEDPAIRQLLDAWLADPANANTNLAVRRVKCAGARRAVVETALELAGEDLPEVLPRGRAVLDGGVWKVARSTFCARLILSDPATASHGACARGTSAR